MKNKKTKFKEWTKLTLIECDLCSKIARWKHPEGDLRRNTLKGRAF